MAKQDDYVRYTVRLPAELYERIKRAAGDKSVNAEIIATLEEAYPPMTMDVELLADYLGVLSNGTETEGREVFLEDLNEKMALTERPWTASTDGLGSVVFHPYTDRPKRKD